MGVTDDSAAPIYVASATGPIYVASATATGEGRNGHTRSSDGVLDLDLAIPKDMGGPGGLLSNPEQLFAAGYAACFHNALKVVARLQQVPLGESAVTADVELRRREGGWLDLAVHLDVEMIGLDQTLAEQLVAGAHERCPYSRAIRGNVDVQIRVEVA